jgi:DNA invertase Pin-like site-specific DNA recombinase
MSKSSDRGKLVRCAIYTRKSTEEGLEQEFNSLDAQREACAAYILSQKHEGWTALPDLYDDGGISGATMDRPALQRLLADVQAGRIDVVVVYKVDRLTRALADFARIVAIFDAAGVSFVSAFSGAAAAGPSSRPSPGRSPAAAATERPSSACATAVPHERRMPVRCAIYTRTSTEKGLSQDFNSLDAQREACAAYILSQKHAGWTALSGRYDHGGCSGGSIGRPATRPAAHRCRGRPDRCGLRPMLDGGGLALGLRDRPRRLPGTR